MRAGWVQGYKCNGCGHVWYTMKVPLPKFKEMLEDIGPQYRNATIEVIL
jgi:hypothetical protein